MEFENGHTGRYASMTSVKAASELAPRPNANRAPPMLGYIQCIPCGGQPRGHAGDEFGMLTLSAVMPNIIWPPAIRMAGGKRR